MSYAVLLDIVSGAENALQVFDNKCYSSALIPLILLSVNFVWLFFEFGSLVKTKLLFFFRAMEEISIQV